MNSLKDWKWWREQQVYFFSWLQGWWGGGSRVTVVQARRARAAPLRLGGGLLPEYRASKHEAKAQGPVVVFEEKFPVRHPLS